MVLIFGFGPGKAEDLGEVAPLTCPTCHNDVFLHHVRSKKSVRLFFVPVIPYRTDEYLLCPICTRGLQISDVQRSAVGGMRAATVSHRRGQVSEALYRTEVQRFWARMGLAPLLAVGARLPGPSVPALEPPRPVPAAPAAPAPAVPAYPPVVAVAEGPTLADRLAELGELHRVGLLTDAEFAAAKERVLRP